MLENISEQDILPEYIAGIATAKKEIEQRRKFVSKQYKLLLGKLMNERSKKSVFNDFLSVEVQLI
jgi:hypothetical protein